MPMTDADTFDFDTVIDRRNTGSYKWNVKEEELALWVADMDFPTAPAARKAIEDCAQRGIFGYADIPDTWAQAYVGWWKRRHSFVMKPEWLTFTSGAVAALSSIVRRVTHPAEKVVLLTPVYNVFFNSVVNAGRIVEECPLRYEEGSYSIDFAQLEETLADPQVRLLIFCNPHNPVGRIWTHEELQHVGELCETHGVLVVSDEVHCDITKPGRTYTPFASVSETCRNVSISLLSPSKAFNLAGLQTAATCIPNTHLRQRIVRGLNNDEVAEPNVFAIDATIAAFNEGDAWLDALLGYLDDNRNFATAELEKVDGAKVIAAEATYLLWIDCRGLARGAAGLTREIREKAGVVLSNGGAYGSSGKGFLRLNLACPQSILAEALERMIPVLETRFQPQTGHKIEL